MPSATTTSHSSPESNLYTDGSLWGPTILCSLFSDQLSQLPLSASCHPSATPPARPCSCSARGLSYGGFPRPSLSSLPFSSPLLPSSPLLFLSPPLSFPPSSLTTSPCEFCTAHLTIGSNLKNVLAPVDEPRPFCGSANAGTSWWCACRSLSVGPVAGAPETSA